MQGWGHSPDVHTHELCGILLDEFAVTFRPHMACGIIRHEINVLIHFHNLHGLRFSIVVECITFISVRCRIVFFQEGIHIVVGPWQRLFLQTYEFMFKHACLPLLWAYPISKERI